MKYIAEFIQINYISIVLSVGLYLVLFTPSRVELKERRIMRNVVTLNLIILIIMYLSDISVEFTNSTLFHNFLHASTYVLRPFELLLVIKIIDHPNHRINKLLFIPAFLNLAIYYLTLNSGLVFSWDQYNHLTRGPLFYTAYFVCLIYLIIAIHKGEKLLRNIIKKTWLLAIYYMICILGSVYMDTVMGEDYMHPIILIMLMSFFIYLYMNDEQISYRLKEEELKNQKNALMISQIQPHFIFNTMNTLYYLCKINPDLAADTIVKFSDYLRDNLDNSQEPNRLIPIMKEVQHTRNYSDIEMLRFRNIFVDYQIEDDSFTLPSLTIQPIVENAIRHGVRDKENGLVEIKTSREGDFHMIQIKDNGIGYIKKEQDMGTHSHIGISNVRSRIESLCQGTVTVQMERNVGTTVIIKIPVMGK